MDKNPAIVEAVELRQLSEKLTSCESDQSAYVALREDVRKKLLMRQPVLTSHELHNYLQLVMLYLTAVLAGPDQENRLASLRVALVLHNKTPQMLVVKPSFYYRSYAIALHPVIAVPVPVDGWIKPDHSGLTALSFLTCSCIFCEHVSQCTQYLPIDPPPASNVQLKSLCIPIGTDPEGILNKFHGRLGQRALPTPIGPKCAGFRCDRIPADSVLKESERPLAVLSIEASVPEWNCDSVADFLRDEVVVEVLRNLGQVLSAHEEQRDRYKVLKACTFLFDLAQHNLSLGQVSEGALGCISEACRQADVSLHLADPSDGQEKAETILRLADGVGANFRGYLINDRQTVKYGVVGRAARKLETKVEIRRKPWQQEVDYTDRSYRNLMPATVANIAVPVLGRGMDSLVGVVNVEWDKERWTEVVGGGDEKDGSTNSARIIKKCARFLSLVLDYSGRSVGPNLSRPVGGQGSEAVNERRLWVSHYVEKILIALEPRSKEKGRSIGREYESLLGDLIKAAGYLCSAQHDYQFGISYRRLHRSRSLLELVPAGGYGVLDGTDEEDAKPRAPIALDSDKSVVAFAARSGLPVFGQILSDRAGEISESRELRMDGLCLDWHRRESRQDINESIPYLPTGRADVLYEVAIPVVVGGETLGVLDFEQYGGEERAVQDEEEAPTKPVLTEDALEGFLDWGRALGLCEELRDLKSQGGAAEWSIYGNLIRFVAQVIAGVPLPGGIADRMAEGYLRILINVGGTERLRENENKETTPGERRRKEECRPRSRDEIVEPMSYQGQFLGEVRFVPPEEAEMREGLFPYCSGAESARMAARFYAAYQTATQLSKEKHADWLTETEFVRWLDEARGSLEEEFRKLEREEGFDDLSVRDLIQAAFEKVQGALLDELGFEAEVIRNRGKVSEYGWLLYHGQFSPQSDMTLLVCGDHGRRRLFLRTKEFLAVEKDLKEGAGSDYHEVAGILEKTFGEHLRRFSWWRRFEDKKRDPEVLWEEAERWASKSGQQKLAAKTVLRLLIEEVMGESYLMDSARPRRGLSRRAAWSGEVQVVPDVYRSPYRGGMRAGYLLYGDAPYSMISLPIVLEKSGSIVRCVGVLNFLRRRMSPQDFKFFKSDEVEAARKLVGVIAKFLRENIRLVEVSRSTSRSETVTVDRRGPTIDRLARRLFAGGSDLSVSSSKDGLDVEVVVNSIAEKPGSLKRFVEERLDGFRVWLSEDDATAPRKSQAKDGSKENLAIRFPWENLVLVEGRLSERDRTKVEDLFHDLETAKWGRVVIFVSDEQIRRELERCMPATARIVRDWNEKEQIEENWKFFENEVMKLRKEEEKGTVSVAVRPRGTLGRSAFQKDVAGVGLFASQKAAAFVDRLTRDEGAGPFRGSVYYSTPGEFGGGNGRGDL